MIRAGLQNWSWLALLIVSPFLLFPSPMTTPLFLLVPVLIWTQVQGDGSTPLDATLLLLAIMVLVSLFATYDIAVSLPKIAGLLLGLAAYFTIAHTATRSSNALVVVAVFIMAGLGLALLVPVVTRWSDKFLPVGQLGGLGFGLASVVNPNELAGALLWVIPLVGLLAVFCMIRFQQVVAATNIRWAVAALVGTISVTGLMLATLILTQSRAAYLGFLVAIPATIIVLFRGKFRWWVFGIGLGMLLVFVGILYWVRPDFILNFNRLLVLNTLNSRVEIWSRALLGLQDFALTGIGLNTFRTIAPTLYPFLTIESGRDIAHAHNEFLQAGLDLGLPGLLAFVGLYLGAFWMIREIGARGQFSLKLKRVRHLRVEGRYLTIGLGASLLAHLVFGLTDAVALGAKPGILFWMLLGLIAGLYRQATAVSVPVQGARIENRWNSNNI